MAALLQLQHEEQQRQQLTEGQTILHEWADVLQHTKFKQIMGRLRDIPNGGRCAIGVLIEHYDDKGGAPEMSYDWNIVSRYLEKRSPSTHLRSNCVGIMNDRGWSFEEIATKLRTL
jgi:hypothetical protein